MKKKINLTLLRSYALMVFLLLSVLNTFGQKQPHEFSIYLGGGYATFVFQKPVSKPSASGYGGDVGMGFTGFFDDNWGIHTGVGFGFFNVTNKINSFSFITPDLEDCEGYFYESHTVLSQYSENHKTMFVTLPLMVQFQTKMERISNRNRDIKAGFYAMAGAKAQFLVANNYKAEISTLSGAAYYPEFNNWIYSLPDIGIGTFKGNAVKGKLKFNLLAMFALEAGLKWQVGNRLFLYTGAYFDIGLHDYTKKSRKPYRNYFTPEHLSDLTLLNFSKRMNVMAVGVKVRLAFSGSSSYRMNCCH